MTALAGVRREGRHQADPPHGSGRSPRRTMKGLMSRRVRVALAMIVIAAAAVSGCRRRASMNDSASDNPGDPAKQPAASGNVTPRAPSTTGSASPGPSEHQAAKVMIAYSRSGGFAGMQDQVTIDESGTVSIRRRDQMRESPLDPEKFRAIKAAFEAAGFSKLEESYTARGADLFTYVITYQDRTVTAMDSAVPPSLEPLIGLLNEIIATSGISR